MEEVKENGIVAQEVSSTTPNAEVEVSKRSLRVETWKNIQKDLANNYFKSIFNRIPVFNGVEKAVALLVSTEQFKNAAKVKVCLERVLDPVKVETIKAGKELYLPVLHESNGLFTKVICPADADDATMINILKTKTDEHRTDISIENKFKLDMLVIGSVVVSRDGYRIGRGNGFVDLGIGLLIHCGVITPETVIATIVDDKQLVEHLPENLFQKYDAPVDLIVTPTQVINVAKRLPRPTGLYWELLSQRRLKIIKALETVKELEEKEGKIITLKSEDTDVESKKPGFRPDMNRRRRTRRPYKKSTTESHTDNENTTKNTNPRPQRRRFYRRPRQSKSTENKNEQQTTIDERKNSNYCVKVTNIARDIRIRALKDELRKRECAPTYITWKGQFGKCFLHYPKSSASNQDTNIEEILKSLCDLSLTVKKPNEETQTFNLNVELLKSDERRNSEDTKQDKAIEEISKNIIRIETWRNVEEDKNIFDGNRLFKRLPKIVDVKNAVALFTTTDEFKNATKIKVSLEDALDGIRIETIKSGKELYLPVFKNSNGLFKKVICSSDADDATIVNTLKTETDENRTEISVENKLKLDMIVIGSFVVSRNGYRIGCGDGFVDLDIGLLIHCGVITPETVIATIVDDKQVEDSLPEEVFKKNDIPVDLIVTPTQVINVSKRLPRPTGLYWELLSQRRLQTIKALEAVKEMEEREGKIITLKSEDTDVESKMSGFRPGMNRRRRTRRSSKKLQRESHTDNENTTKSSNANSQRRRNFTRPHQSNYCVKVTNIARGIKIKDLKDELRKRECAPSYITWKGQSGKCFLHYPETRFSSNIDVLVQNLANLSFAIKKNETETETCKLNVELLKNKETTSTQNEIAQIDATISTASV